MTTTGLIESSAWEDALECECFVRDEYCYCNDGCECGCTECDCKDWEIINSCACGGNCQCGGNSE